MSPVSARSLIDALASDLPNINARLPFLSTRLGPLLAGLRPALLAADQRDTQKLTMDIENLCESVVALSALSEAGVRNADVEEAEGHLIVLVAGMQEACTRILTDKAKLVRFQTQAAVHRIDPDIKPQDVSDAFRTLFATPAPAPALGQQVVTALALPEVGGPVGQIIGEVLCAEIPETRVFGDAADSDTSYLPPGHVITLRAGEQVLLRTAGSAQDDAPFSIQNFDAAAPAMLVQARAHGVQIFGPATIAPTDLPDLSVVRADLEGVEARLKKTSRVFKFLSQKRYKSTNGDVHHNGADGKRLGTTFLASISGFIGTAGLGASMNTVMGMFVVAVLGLSLAMLNEFWEGEDTTLVGETFSLKKSGGAHAPLRIFMQRALQRPDLRLRTLMDHEIVSIEGRRILSTAHRIRFFPARKIVTDADQGVRVIRPQAALPAPTAEFVIPSVSEKDTV